VFLAGGEGQPVLYVRSLDGLSATPLPGTEDASFPFWSPDSRSVAFFAQGKLKRVDVVSGGAPATICNAPQPRGGAWGRDGVILFTPDTRQPIFRVPASGGTPVAVTKVNSEEHTTHRWPSFMPDGKHFVYLAAAHNDPRSEKTGIYFASLDGRENRRLFHSLANAIYSSGYLLGLRENSLVAGPFDPSSGRLLGEPVPVAEGVQFDLSTWHGVFSASDGNVLAYQPGGMGSGTRLIWYDRTGRDLGFLGEKENFVGPIRISFDGRKIAAASGDPVSDIVLFDPASGVRTRLTFSTSLNMVGNWSPDGSQFLFSSNRQKNGRFSIYTKPSNGTAPEQLFYPAGQGLDASEQACDWSRNGQLVAFAHSSPAAAARIWVLPLDGDRKAFPLTSEHEGDESSAVFSPDSRWVAYQVFTSGAPTIFVAAVRGAGGKWQVSSAGGYAPRWRSDGKEIYYLAPDMTLMAAQVDGSGSEFRVGAVRPLFHTRAVPNPSYSYDVTPDGQRFLINSLEAEGTPPITLVLNWKPALKN
jgi:Tol biopolymer transport system component